MVARFKSILSASEFENAHMKFFGLFLKLRLMVNYGFSIDFAWFCL
ncbi:hypothetical protein SLEP1_g18273 [Rubroshorea leprosula]|uniref:Uncharacterized protein n=1 Tax=Rubroshorea leprosula TaxID=152421 RepID=A0AAV5J5U8_9ROSI|nr:hypothetical protein SLEP1_g18273 [Rubroshorea leprosula]